MQRKRRHQTGAVEQRKWGGKVIWTGQYRDMAGVRKRVPLPKAKNKSQARTELAAILAPLNARANREDITVGRYVEEVYIPFGIRKWKGSTAITTVQRVRQYLGEGSLSDVPFSKLDWHMAQKYLDQYAHLPASVVHHLRFDLQAVWRMAFSDGLIKPLANKMLFTPRTCKPAVRRVMTGQDVTKALAALAPRERAFVNLSLITGMRPGELIALKWPDITDLEVSITKRIYKGVTDVPKNGRERIAGLSEEVKLELEEWRKFAPPSEYIFSSETLVTPITYDNIWRRNIRPRLKEVGLGWVNYLVLRRTNSSLMQLAGADVKVSADQRGHGIGVALDIYTQSSLKQLQAAAQMTGNYLNSLNDPPTGSVN